MALTEARGGGGRSSGQEQVAAARDPRRRLGLDEARALNTSVPPLESLRLFVVAPSFSLPFVFLKTLPLGGSAGSIPVREREPGPRPRPRRCPLHARRCPLKVTLHLSLTGATPPLWQRVAARPCFVFWTNHTAGKATPWPAGRVRVHACARVCVCEHPSMVLEGATDREVPQGRRLVGDPDTTGDPPRGWPSGRQDVEPGCVQSRTSP